MNDQSVASALGTLSGPEQRFQQGQIKSQQVRRHFPLCPNVAAVATLTHYSNCYCEIIHQSFHLWPWQQIPSCALRLCLIPCPSSSLLIPAPLISLSLQTTPSSSMLFHYRAHHPSSLLLLSPFITTSTFLSLLLSLFLNLNPDQSTISCTFFITFLSYSSCWAQCRVILLFSLSLSLSGAALQGPADWIRAFYSHWVDHQAEMQISVGTESVL